MSADAKKHKFSNGTVVYVVDCPNCGEESFQYGGKHLVPKEEDCESCYETFKVYTEEHEDDE